MASTNKKGKSKYTIAVFKRELPLHLMLLPGLILVAVFNYTPMAGLIIAFQKFIPSKGMFGDQQWVGLGNFTYVFSLPGFDQALKNTIVIAFWKIVLGLIVPIVFALMLNEVNRNGFKRTVQTIVYLPYFLSWVVLGGILTNLLSMDSGIVNGILQKLGFAPIGFLTDERFFVPTMVVSMIWKTFGWNTIIYLAAMTGIDPQLYEAATVDGANRWQQLLHITLPCIRSTIIVILITRIGGLMQAGFEQIFVLYHPGVYGVADIIDTYVYRMGLQEGKFELAAVGLFKSVINFVLVVIANKAARMAGEEGIY